jgi:formylglycine-generating enzyme required for sulfatase activity
MTTQTSLRESMHLSFSEDELKDLTFELGVDFEDLPANLGKGGKIRELILLLDRNGRIPDLVGALNRLRPNVDWPDATKPLSDARLLGEEEKPQLAYEPEMIGIVAGSFLMGSDAENETPQHQVTLPEYWIGKHPVTHAQYAEFIKQAGHPAPKKAGWFGKKAPQKKLDHPVVSVSWYDCMAYCQWLSEQSGRNYRLPSEAEWEKAARGEDGRAYPWGNEWDAARCNHDGESTTPVTAYANSASPYGCLDMAGNVWEWTSTLWGPDWLEPEFSYPYDREDGREAADAGPEVNRIFRGGAYGEDIAQLRCSARRWYAPEHADLRRGFRVVMQRHSE